MSLSIRPVVETWGESIDVFTGFSAELALASIAVAIASSFYTEDYGDLRVVIFDDGKGFIDYIEKMDAEQQKKMSADMEVSADDDDDDDETESTQTRAGQLSSFLGNLHAMADSWHTMIDPKDGCLRFYIDTN